MCQLVFNKTMYTLHTKRWCKQAAALGHRIVAIFTSYKDIFVDYIDILNQKFSQLNITILRPKWTLKFFVMSYNQISTRFFIFKKCILLPFQVIWRKLPDVSPLTIGQYVFVNDVAMSVQHARESEDWKLIISGVHSSHSGEYECQVPTADKQMRKQFYLTVTGTRPTPHTYRL